MQQHQQVKSKDTIPAELKQHFFKDRTPPNLIEDYDVIGFDADHCIVKYNIRALSELLITTHLDDFVDLGYPKSIRDFKITDENCALLLNWSLFDIDTGLIVKLTEGKEVARAMRGFKALTKTEIIKTYGNPPIYHAYEWPNTTHLASKEGAYWGLMTFFDTAKAALIMSAVDLIDRGILKNKSYHDIAGDLRTVVYRNYVHYTDKEVKPIATYGKFFPPVVKDPSKYIQYQPELRDTLNILRRNGKKLFVATNSHSDYTEVIMRATLGEDWRTFFDIICSNARKPLFFWDQKFDPFYEIDTTKANYKGRELDGAHELKEGENYIFGNSKTLTGFFKRITNKEQVRVAFFGDQYITDVYSSSLHPNWDGIAVVEELLLYDDSYAEGVDPEMIPLSPLWGGDYFLDKDEAGNIKRNYFIVQLEDCARYMLPLVKNIKHWIHDD